MTADLRKRSSVVHPLGKLNGKAEVIAWNRVPDSGYTADLGCFGALLLAVIVDGLLIAGGIVLWRINIL